MKKRIISITLILAMAAASLLACTSKEESKETTSTTDTKKEETASKPVKVTLNEVAHSIFYAPSFPRLFLVVPINLFYNLSIFNIIVNSVILFSSQHHLPLIGTHELIYQIHNSTIVQLIALCCCSHPSFHPFSYLAKYLSYFHFITSSGRN